MSTTADDTTDRIIGTTDDGAVEFLPYRPEHFAGLRSVLYDFYYPGECLASGTGLNAPDAAAARDEMTDFCRLTLAEGLSIVARDVRTKQIVGHVGNKLQRRDDPLFERYFSEKLQTVECREYFRAMLQLADQCDLFEYNGGCDVLMEIMFLGVAPTHGRRGVGLKLVEYSVLLARQVKAGEWPELVPNAEVAQAIQKLGGATAMFASNYSKSIGRKLDFKLHGEVVYAEMRSEGRTYQERIPNPLQRTMQLMSVAI